MTDAFEQRRKFGFDETRGISWLPLQVLVSGTLLHGIGAVLFSAVECAYGSVVTHCVCERVVTGAGESWARHVTEQALSRRKQTLVVTSH